MSAYKFVINAFGSVEDAMYQAAVASGTCIAQLTPAGQPQDAAVGLVDGV